MQHNGRLVSPNNHPEVPARLAELREDVRKRSVVTAGDIVAKLEEAFKFAEADRKPSAMVSAAMGQAKVLGVIAPRKQLGIKPLYQMSEEELMMLLGKDDAGVYCGSRGMTASAGSMSCAIATEVLLHTKNLYLARLHQQHDA